MPVPVQGHGDAGVAHAFLDGLGVCAGCDSEGHGAVAEGVRPAQVRVGERTLKGYRAADFEDPFGRYLPPDETSETSETPQVV